METTYTWQDTDAGGTLMTLRNSGEPSGFSKLMTPLMGMSVRRANNKDLRALKRLLEALTACSSCSSTDACSSSASTT